jgi:hypothetical protein
MQMEPQMPTSQTAARYFILASFGCGVTAFVERDTADMDRETTIRDLIGMQIDQPLAVFCAEDGRWTDATDEICQAIVDRSITGPINGPLHRTLVDWIENHLGTLVANELEAA